MRERRGARLHRCGAAVLELSTGGRVRPGRRHTAVLAFLVGRDRFGLLGAAGRGADGFLREVGLRREVKEGGNGAIR